MRQMVAYPADLRSFARMAADPRPLDDALASMLACPSDRGRLRRVGEDRVTCDRCGRAFPIVGSDPAAGVDGVLDLLALLDLDP